MIPSSRMRSVVQGAAWAAVALAASLARAEGSAPAKDASTSDRLYGVATILPTAGGLISIGGPALRRLTAGSRRWETLHVVEGDNLYRVAADDSGRLLAAWSKDRFIHLVSPGQKPLVSFPKPLAPEGVTGFQVSNLELSPKGGDALVFMSGSVQVTTGQFRGPSWSTSVYRIALDGRSDARLLFRVDHGYLLHASPLGAVFAMPKH